MDGVLRGIVRNRPTDSDRLASLLRLQRKALRTARRLAIRVAPAAVQFAGSQGLPSTRRVVRHVSRRRVTIHLASERTLPIAISVVVLLASVVSLGPTAARSIGASTAEAGSLRLAIGGASAAQYEPEDVGGLLAESPSGAWLDDGSLYKPVAVDTTVQDGSSLLRHYAVRAGDTLTGIASRFGVSMMTIWWANHLTSKDSLKVGTKLIIPPATGLLLTVKVGDTLTSLATKYRITEASILEANGLTDTNLIIGQTLLLPGAKGAPIPIPKPKPKPVARSTSPTVSSRGYTYTGGSWAWPVRGGNNYISQYYHYGHYGIDIAAQYGTPVVAARAGRVTFAGWKNNGGGWQVWLNHGGSLNTVYMHMSSLTTTAGASLSRGQQLGRVGTSGWSSGSHLMFEVWVGAVWEPGSSRVNPLRYY